MKICLAFVTALFFSSPVLASTLRCDDCSFDQMNAAAVQQADNAADYATPVYVVNLPANAALKYSFTRVWVAPDRENGIPGYRYTVANTQPAETEISAYVNFIFDASKWSTLVDPGFNGEGLPGSVYQDMSNPSAHSALQSYLNGNAIDLTQRFLQFLQGLNPIKGFDPGALAIVITVHYSDGSSAQYHYDPITKKWDRIKGTERDSHGNVVVANPSDFTNDGGGERMFNFEGGADADLIHFLQTAEMFGIPVTGSTTRRMIVCSTIGGVTSCHTVII